MKKCFLLLALCASCRAKAPGLFATVHEQLQTLDKMTDPDSVVLVNHHVQETFFQHAREVFLIPDTVDDDWVMAHSADQQFCLVSWDTREGGTMIIFETLAFFKQSDGRISVKMISDTTDDGDDTYSYDTIYTVKDGDRVLYLALGSGQESTALPIQEVRAFAIIGDTLSSPDVFPDKQSYFSVWFDYHHLSDGQRVPEIKIEHDGKVIHVPESDDGSFAGVYRTLVWRKEGVYTIL